jgi:mRNA interferase RelE/StbE
MSKPVYDLQISKTAKKVLQKLPRDLLARLSKAIDALSSDPRPAGCKKLTGQDDLYRVRVGDWRIIYLVEDERLIVLVVEVAPRGGAYRNL